MTTDEVREREEIAGWLARRADRYRNAGDVPRGEEADTLAEAVRAAPTLDDARALAAGEPPPARPRFWRRLRDRFRAGTVSDDS